jgi:hypothetical protein
MHELVLELVSPYRGWDEFPEFARGAFLSRPAHEFPEFPEFAFQRRLGGLRREPAPDLVQQVASLPL